MPETEPLHLDALIWDQVFPATPACGTMAEHSAMLERMRATGYTAVSITVAYDPESTNTTLARIAEWRAFLRKNVDHYLLINEPEDVVRAKGEGRLAVGFHFQGSTPLGQDVSLVEIFYRLGVRQAILAYNQNNPVGGGCHAPNDPGLSPFGYELIAEMQRVGMVVDCSHTGLRTSRAAFEAATAPMIYSHANPHRAHSHERNIPDELARACAATGGVVGLSGVSLFLGSAERLTEHLFAHVDHWVQLIGPTHVGLGLDTVTSWDATRTAVKRDPTKWPANLGYQSGNWASVEPEHLGELTDRMLGAGYDENACRAILGENWLRIARECWRPPM